MTRVSYRGGDGFTLVEMLVSVAVLVLLLTFTVQMINSTALSTGLSDSHQDSDSQARTVFDRMSKDFAGMPQRKDVDFIFAKQGPGTGTTGSSDVMIFYSEAPAFSSSNTAVLAATSSVALIGYCVNPGVNNTGTTPTLPAFCLQRLGKGLTWDANVPTGAGVGGIAFLTFPTVNSTTPLTPTTLVGNSFTSAAVGSAPGYNGSDPDFDILSSEVFRMEFCFQVKNLTNPSAPAAVYSNYPIAYYLPGAKNQSTPSSSAPGSANIGDRWYDTANNRAFACTGLSNGAPVWTPNGMADVTAIVVAIAILDTNSRKIVTQSELAKAASSLADFPNPTSATAANPTLMATMWQNTVNQASPTFASLTGMPPSAASQVRIYQRYLYLNNY